jgi:hypothetical protein
MAGTWKNNAVLLLAVASCALSGEQATSAAEHAIAAQGRRAEAREEARDTNSGRSVIFRAGELPRFLPKATVPAGGAEKSILPTHYLDTSLPVLIQGAPNGLVLRRYMTTG